MRRNALLLFVAALLARAGPCSGRGTNLAILIGISRPGLQEGPKPLTFAADDVDHLKAKFQSFDTKFDVVSFKDGQDVGATTAAVSQCVDDATNERRRKLVIFISARGYSSAELPDDGYVITWDAAIDKLQSGVARNGLSIKMLAKYLARDGAAEKYLLLDLHREPAESGFPNLIDNRLIRFLPSATSRIILASSGNKGSGESKTGGYYANGLLGVLAPGIDLETLFNELKEKTKANQIPGRPKPTPEWRDRLISSSRQRTVGPLIASLFPALYFQDGPGPQAEDAKTIDEAVAAEQAGEQIFIRYGEGNHFPGDPFDECGTQDPRLKNIRLCREEYEFAAREFAHAADLRQQVRRPDEELIASLREREHFSRAQADLLADHADLVPKDFGVQLGAPPNFLYAESHNILGISYLQKKPDYQAAQAQFKEAKRKAPHWAYPRHNLALAYIEQGDYTAAEREYREAIRLTPVAAKFHQKDSGNPCFHGRDVMVAGRPYLYYNLGVLLQRLNRLGEAQRQYCLAEESFHLRMEVLDSGSAELAKLRQEAGAVNLADLNNSLGVLFEARNKKETAETQFKKAIGNNSALSAARFNLARMAEKKEKDPTKAQQLYQDVINGPSCGGSATKDLGCQAASAARDRLATGTSK